MNCEKLLRFIALTGIVSLTIASCTSSGENSWKKHSKNAIERLIGHTVEVNDTLQSFPDSSSLKNLLNSNCKIIFCVNVDCSVCVLKFEYWQKFIDAFHAKNGETPNILAIVSGHPLSGTIQEFVDSKWNHEWVYDPEEDFILEYELVDDRFQAMVLDSSNKIILIGNPVHNKAMEPLYEKALLKAS